MKEALAMVNVSKEITEALVDKKGFTADYIGRFAASVVVHWDAFRMALSEHSSKERRAFLDEVWERLQRISAE